MSNKQKLREDLLKDIRKEVNVETALEIGVWKGEFSKVIMDILLPEVLFMVDPWEVNEDYEDAWYGPKISKEEVEKIYLGVVSCYKGSTKAEVIRTKSSNLPLIFDDNYFDFIYIDGDHTEDGFRKDLELSIDLCNPGGYIVCDDYAVEGWWGNAITKVIDNFEDNRVEHVVSWGTQYVFKKQ